MRLGPRWVVLLAPWCCEPVAATADLPESFRSHVVCAYDFEHPAPDDPAVELDQGSSGTRLQLVNGGAAMRVADNARPGGAHALQTRQIAPEHSGNDDWKAGCYAPEGIATLARFRSASGITLLGWVKSTATEIRPALNTTTSDPADRYKALGLFGLLHGSSDGHPVRALIELFPFNGQLRLVAIGRRLDDGAGRFAAAVATPDELLPHDTWVHLAATFDYTTGEIALYRNGRPIETLPPEPAGDPWQLAGAAAPRTSETTPVGLKIGGSHPQNTRERNPFDGRFDDLIFLDRALTPAEIGSIWGHLTSTERQTVRPH